MGVGLDKLMDDFYRRGLITRPTQIGVFHGTLKGRGLRVYSSVTAAFRVYGDDGGDVAWKTGSVPDLRVSLSRYLVTTDQTGGKLRIHGAMGHVKAYNGKWNNEQVAGVYGYLELVRAAGTITYGSYGKSAAVIGCVETLGSLTVDTYHQLGGVMAISKIASGATLTGKVGAFVATKYDATNWSDGTARTDWPFAMVVDGCAKFLNISGSCVSAAAAGAGASLQILITVNGSPYALAVNAVGT
jgi:hypothetical protein